VSDEKILVAQEWQRCINCGSVMYFKPIIVTENETLRQRIRVLEDVVAAAEKAVNDTPHRRECASKYGLHCICWQRDINKALANLALFDCDKIVITAEQGEKIMKALEEK
jgi:hypothetical protein